jgi:hemolysin III
VAETLTAPVDARPRLRGVSHQIAFFIAPFAFIPLLIAAPTAQRRLAVAVYGIAIIGLFGVSALFHRHMWATEAARLRMRRLDHSMIFVAIAGTYTPIAAVALSAPVAAVVLTLVWAGAAGGIVARMIRRRSAATWLTAIPYVALGWVAVFVMPQLWNGLSPGAFILVAVGGVLYTLGALAYATKRPNPIPNVFGYHEVFHAFVVAAAATHYAAVVTAVV